MNAPQSSRRPTAAVVVETLLWLWLICLSIFVVLGYQAMSDLADQEQFDTRLQRLAAQIADLAGTTQSLQQRPAAVTAASLQDTRQALETRIAQVEQVLGGHATADDLQALRAEIEQIKAQQAAARAAALAQPRTPSKPAAKPEPPLPFRVIGAELRAGQRSLSVAPSSGDYALDQLQVLMPGDAVGPWRLEAIQGNTAVFRSGNQTRRVAIP